MGVFTFMCKLDGGSWSATCYDNEEIAAVEADSRWELEKALRQVAVDNSSGGGVSCNFNWVTPKSALCQFIVGGSVMAVAAGGGGGGGGGGGADAGGDAEPAKEEEAEEESDDDMGFSLFD